ncbi:MAG: site-specific integrase [Oscillospiraceae bacterium]|nr:site-specific integrase [Oscillospiraceae bacterium]
MSKKKSSRNANGSGTIRKRSDGRWEGRYSLGFDPKTGKQLQKSVYGATQKEVRQKLTQIESELDLGVYIEPNSMTLAEWLNTWLKDYIGNVKPATVKSYTDHVQLNIIPNIGRIPLCKLSTATVQAMYNKLQREKGLSPKTIKNVHGVLHRAMTQAQKMGYIRDNPLNAVTLPRIERTQITPLDDDDLIRFLQAIKGNPYENVFFVTVFTGLRQGEVLGLTWDCVNFEQNTLYICKQHGKVKGGQDYVFSSLKNDKPRLIMAASGVMNVLKKQKALQEHWADIAGSSWNNEKNLVFTTEIGRYLSNQTVYLAFKKIVKSLGLDAVRFHDLRHTFAVNSLKAGDDIKTVQENLGHHTAAFTLDTYAHVTSRMKQDSADRMEKYLQKVTA